MAGRDEDSTQRLVDIELDVGGVVRWNVEIEHERKVAVYDLLESNRFAPVGVTRGPYRLRLALAENRLIFDIASDDDGKALAKVSLPLAGFRRLVKDYFTVCESYFSAIKTASPSKIEALDMGRRGLHDEGSETLRERLDGKIDIDFETARRLFTLICVLHLKG